MESLTYQELVAIRDGLVLLEPCGDDAEAATAIVEAALVKIEAAIERHDCFRGIHSWIDATGEIAATAQCALCGEYYNQGDE